MLSVRRNAPGGHCHCLVRWTSTRSAPSCHDEVPCIPWRTAPKPREARAGPDHHGPCGSAGRADCARAPGRVLAPMRRPGRAAGGGHLSREALAELMMMAHGSEAVAQVMTHLVPLCAVCRGRRDELQELARE